MLVMSERGAEKLLESKFTLGAEGSVSGGPIGRTATAQTDAQLHTNGMRAPKAAARLMALLNRYSARERRTD